MAEDLIEWRRVVCLDPGGLIPKFMAQKSTLNKLVEVNDPIIQYWPFLNDDTIWVLLGKYRMLEVAEKLGRRGCRTISEAEAQKGFVLRQN